MLLVLLSSGLLAVSCKVSSLHWLLVCC